MEIKSKSFIDFRNCPLQFTENANKDLVKTLTEMGIKIGECKAENQCLETKNEKLEDKNEKLEEQNEKLEDQNEKFDAINEKLDTLNEIFEAQNVKFEAINQILQVEINTKGRVQKKIHKIIDPV